MYIFDFGQIQYFYKVFKTDFEIQYFQYRVGTLPTLLMASLTKKQYPKPKNFFFIADKKTCQISGRFEQLYSAISKGAM